MLLGFGFFLWGLMAHLYMALGMTWFAALLIVWHRIGVAWLINVW